MIAATSVFVTVILPLLLALVGGGAVAFYLAKPQKNRVVMETTEKAVSIIGATIDRQEKENAQALHRNSVLEGELRKAGVERGELEERVRVLETDLVDARKDLAEALQVSRECRLRIVKLERGILDLGGSIDHDHDTRDTADE